MNLIKKATGYFTKLEIILWCSSVFLITASYLIFDRGNALTLIASIIGVTSLILNAKGNPLGQLLMIIFSILYGIISYGFSYYGEMITYLLMTAPMALFALISWLRHPYKGKRSQVEVGKVRGLETVFMLLLTALVTLLFYFILKHLNTANLLPSTLSVTTSFLAVYLTFRRSPCFALAYASNDIVLLVLWIMASFKDVSYISVVICFAVFLVNDIYGFCSWRKMEKKQKKGG